MPTINLTDTRITGDETDLIIESSLGNIRLKDVVIKELTVTNDPIETTSMADNYRTFIPGIPSIELSIGTAQIEIVEGEKIVNKRREVQTKVVEKYNRRLEF